MKQRSGGRITVVESVYYQGLVGGIIEVRAGFSITTDSGEQVYQRNLLATEDWTPIDLGWIKNPLYLVIHNTEGKVLTVNPTEEEKQSIADRVIELAFAGNESQSFLISPNQSFRCSTANFSQLVIRCRKGQAVYTLTVIPG